MILFQRLRQRRQRGRGQPGSAKIIQVFFQLDEAAAASAESVAAAERAAATAAATGRRRAKSIDGFDAIR